MATDATNLPPQGEPVLRDCVDTLCRTAKYHLPTAPDQRLLWLSENKEQLDQAQRAELAALIELADARSLDKVQAKAVLKQLAQLYPDLVCPSQKQTTGPPIPQAGCATRRRIAASSSLPKT